MANCGCGARLTFGLSDGWAEPGECEGCSTQICSECAGTWDEDGEQGLALVKATCESCAETVSSL